MNNIRPYKDGDDISPLFNNIYGTKRDEKDWKWQYELNPQGESIRTVSVTDNKLVGHSGMSSMDIVVGGKIKKAALSLDSIVDEEFRRQGIFKNILLENFNIAQREGYEFITGFPTLDAIGTLIDEEISMDDITEIPFFINLYKMDNFLHGIVKIKALAKILSYPAILFTKFVYREKRIKLDRKYNIEEIDDFSEDFDILWNKVRSKDEIMTARTSKFLNWRIKEHPRTDYITYGAYENEELLGYIVLKMEERKVRKNSKLKVGTIIDLIGLDDDVIRALYLKSKEYFKSESTDFVVLWASPTMKYRQLFIDLGFYKTRSGLPFFLKSFKNEKNSEYIMDEKNWYLMPIESDIY